MVERGVSKNEENDRIGSDGSKIFSVTEIDDDREKEWVCDCEKRLGEDDGLEKRL